MTLIELLVVVSIITALLSMGIGGYLALTRGASFEATWSRVESMVRRARNNTLYEAAPAGVFIEDVTRAELKDPTEFLECEVLEEKKGTVVLDVRGRRKSVTVGRERIVRIARVTRVRAVGFDTVGAWHLEQSDDSFGYLGRRLRVVGGENVFGKVGGAVLLNDGRAGSKLVARKAADDAGDPFRLASGGRIEMWAYARPGGGDGYLVRRKGSYELKVRGDGVIVGGTPRDLVETEGYFLPFRRWARVALAFSADHVEISVDDVVRAYLKTGGTTGGEKEGGGLSPPEEADLVFGEGFVGVLDEIRVQSRVEVQGFDLPEQFRLEAPGAVVFLRGRLAPVYHTGPVKLELVKDDVRAAMTIQMSGRIVK